MPKEIYLSGLTADQLRNDTGVPARRASAVPSRTFEVRNQVPDTAGDGSPPADFARNAHRLGEPR